MPILYYTTVVLLEKGYDVLWIEYDYNSERFKTASKVEGLKWLNFDPEASYKAAGLEKRYAQVLLVGKSLRTYALVRINEITKNIEGTIWFAPPLR